MSVSIAWSKDAAVQSTPPAETRRIPRAIAPDAAAAPCGSIILTYTPCGSSGCDLLQHEARRLLDRDRDGLRDVHGALRHQSAAENEPCARSARSQARQSCSRARRRPRELPSSIAARDDDSGPCGAGCARFDLNDDPRLAALLALCDAFVRAPPSVDGYDRRRGAPRSALAPPGELRDRFDRARAQPRSRRRNADVVPLMLLRCSYLPGATEVPLNFIEPRMREMCRDTDRFVVAFAPDETLAACCGVGVVFELRSRTEETHCPRPKTVGVSDVAPRPFAIRRVLNGRRHAIRRSTSWRRLSLCAAATKARNAAAAPPPTPLTPRLPRSPKSWACGAARGDDRARDGRPPRPMTPSSCCPRSQRRPEWAARRARRLALEPRAPLAGGVRAARAQRRDRASRSRACAQRSTASRWIAGRRRSARPLAADQARRRPAARRLARAPFLKRWRDEIEAMDLEPSRRWPAVVEAP